MVSRLQEIDTASGDQVHQPVLLGKPPRPRAGGQEPERFWLAYAFERVAHDGCDEIQGSKRQPAIRFDPEAQILEELRLEDRNPSRKL